MSVDVLDHLLFHVWVSQKVGNCTCGDKEYFEIHGNERF
jgi:hypothetical protein